MINHHHEYIVSIPLAVILVMNSWWIPAIEEFSWIAGKLVLPALGIALAILQIWYMIRKHKSL